MKEWNTNILDVSSKPEENWKLFFGDTGNFLRVDRVDYKIFDTLYNSAFGNFWTHRVVNFQADATGWDNIDENGQRIILLNLGYQTLMDSGVVNDYNYLSICSSNAELNILYQYIAQNESIHALSYSYGLSQMFGAKAKEKIDIVYEDEVIKSRLENEAQYSGDLIELAVKQGKTDDETKKALLKTLISTYFLEQVKFPFSFFVAWSINKGYNNAIQGFSMLLKLIAWDELTTHAPTGMNVIKTLRKEKRQGFSHLFKEEIDDFIMDYAKIILEEELKWNEYLFKDGPVQGFTKAMGEHFIKYFVDYALTHIGYDKITNEKKSDVIDWYNEYRDIKNQNAALQEISNISYQKGNLMNDLSKLDGYGN